MLGQWMKRQIQCVFVLKEPACDSTEPGEEVVVVQDSKGSETGEYEELSVSGTIESFTCCNSFHPPNSPMM